MKASDFSKVLDALLARIRVYVGEKVAPLDSRLAVLEQRALSDSISGLGKTLREPVVPVHDSRGNIVAARRGSPEADRDARRIEELEARISALERKLEEKKFLSVA